jgi:hypothetical protein
MERGIDEKTVVERGKKVGDRAEYMLFSSTHDRHSEENLNRAFHDILLVFKRD